MIYLKLAWAHVVRAYYARALSELEARGQHHSNEWTYVFWKSRAAEDRCRDLERKNNARFH